MRKIDVEEQYAEFLNDCDLETVLGGCVDKARLLREYDPTAYRCGLNDYDDSVSRDPDVYRCSECEGLFTLDGFDDVPDDPDAWLCEDCRPCECEDCNEKQGED